MGYSYPITFKLMQDGRSFWNLGFKKKKKTMHVHLTAGLCQVCAYMQKISWKVFAVNCKVHAVQT